MVCDVCDEVFSLELNTTSEENAIVQCKKCGVRVHQCCYGVDSYSTEWLCNFCEKNDTQQQKRCILCPNREGALKRTTCKKWVHQTLLSRTLKQRWNQ
jgi:hypothetical protein